MLAFAYEYPTHIEVIVTDGTDEGTVTFNFSKEQDAETSVNEAILLVEAATAPAEIPVPVY